VRINLVQANKKKKVRYIRITHVFFILSITNVPSSGDRPYLEPTIEFIFTELSRNLLTALWVGYAHIHFGSHVYVSADSRMLR